MKTFALFHSALRAVAIVAMLMLCFPAVGAPSEDLRPFDAKSVNTIREAHAGKPFVLAFWSIYCAPCREEMADWNALRRKYPGVPIVLVATDTPDEWPNVERFLARYNPGPVEKWAFADEFVERVRYAIDPKWRGELPRAYFYDAAHAVEAHTGKLDINWTNDWFKRQAKSK